MISITNQRERICCSGIFQLCETLNVSNIESVTIFHHQEACGPRQDERRLLYLKFNFYANPFKDIIFPSFYLTRNNHFYNVKTSTPNKTDNDNYFDIVATETKFLKRSAQYTEKMRFENLPLYYSSLDFKSSFRIGYRSHILKQNYVSKSL